MSVSDLIFWIISLSYGSLLLGSLILTNGNVKTISSGVIFWFLIDNNVSNILNNLDGIVVKVTITVFSLYILYLSINLNLF